MIILQFSDTIKNDNINALAPILLPKVINYRHIYVSTIFAPRSIQETYR